MNKNNLIKTITIFLVWFLVSSGFQGSSENNDLIRAKSTLQQIFSLYKTGRDHLLIETYPYKSDNKAKYLAGDDTLAGQRVAYLWPTSGVFSGVNALLKATGDKQYRQMLDKTVLPGLEQYYDSMRKPTCYQSYITSVSKSDRYYDDNVWLALDFCELYRLDRNAQYISIFRDNMDHLWNHVRDKNGLFSKDWKGQKDDEYKWLLDQASLVEIWATLAEME